MDSNAFNKVACPQAPVLKPHVCNPFDPNKPMYDHCHEHPVAFMSGRYLDIANTKGKDPHTLYLGTSLSTNLLNGIFLGDFELTSRVKDVSLVAGDKGVNTLVVKFVNDKNKLLSIKTTFATESALTNLENQFMELINKTVYPIDTSLSEKIEILDTSVNLIEDSIEIIDSSISDIYERLDVIDSSYVDLIEELETGKYNYTVKMEVGSFEEGYKKTFKLFKGEEEQTDSDPIEIVDYTVKKFEFDSSSNFLSLVSWPKEIEDLDLVLIIATKSDGTPIYDTTSTLNKDLINSISVDLNPFVDNICEKINTDSSVNDRLIVLENSLSWETLQ